MDETPTISTSRALRRAWTNAMWPIGMILEGEREESATEPNPVPTRASILSEGVRAWRSALKIGARAPKARDAST